MLPTHERTVLPGAMKETGATLNMLESKTKQNSVWLIVINNLKAKDTEIKCRLAIFKANVYYTSCISQKILITLFS